MRCRRLRTGSGRDCDLAVAAADDGKVAVNVKTFVAQFVDVVLDEFLFVRHVASPLLLFSCSAVYEASSAPS